jgi:16S rRNA processing protein RimM
LSNKVYIAKIGKTVGLHGQLKLHIDSDFPEQFKKNSQFITNKKTTLIIESFNSKNNTVKFIGFDTIDDAKKLTNKQLFVSQEDTREICNLSEKQFFWFDIIGCNIIENGEILGKVTDVQRMPLSDYLEVETDKNLRENNYSNSFLLPYIDDYIEKVEIENKIIKVKNAKEILEAS